MKKWDNPYNNATNTCMCTTNQGLFIPNRQLSLVIAGLLVIFFALFITGYFIGKRADIAQLNASLHQDDFSDQVYTATLNTSLAQSDNNELVSPPFAPLHMSYEHTNGEQDTPTHSLSTTVQLEHDGIVADTECRYYAQLIGFGTENAAKKFVQKNAKKTIRLHIKKHTSTTAKGTLSHWYQVITEPYTNRDELVALVEQLTHEERLKGVLISTC